MAAGSAATVLALIPSRAAAVGGPADLPALVTAMFGAGTALAGRPRSFGAASMRARRPVHHTERPGSQSLPSPPHTAAALFATRAELTATVDGVAIPDLERYRARSPLFTVALPPDNWLEVEPAVAAGVADGYWLLLAPLPPGEHELRFGGALPEIGVVVDITYRLSVAEPTVTEPPAGTPAP